MKPAYFLLSFFLLLNFALQAREYHVSVNGDDSNEGTVNAPFKTIAHAAGRAMAGDVVIVHEGVYREYVDPKQGGTSDDNRIVYKAGDNENVEIKGSEVIKNWKKFKGDVWKVIIPNSFFGKFNPYKEIIQGDWFNDHGRVHHPGQVYLNGRSFYESATIQGVLDPKPAGFTRDTYSWYCETDKENTYIYANFHGANPNKELVEINVRQGCFYPSKPGVNYITVSGFKMSQAATPWAPPTAEQIGLLGTHWSKGWIIENNVISESRCVGITLGKDRKTGQNVWSKNPCKDGATHYNEVIFRALEEGWSKETIGSHIVRNNEIFNCEQAGIVGSLGAVFSQIYGNHIHDIWTKRQFSGAEIAGIKIHAPIDAIIRNNRIHNAGRGIWLDWMAQGTRVSSNLLYDNTINDLFVEVSHGPFLVDNNILLSIESIRTWSEGGIYANNFIAGRLMVLEITKRFTPYHFAHSTKVAGLKNTTNGKQWFYNNLFIAPPEGSPKLKVRAAPDKAYGLVLFDKFSFTVKADGNVYLGAAMPCKLDANHISLPDFDAKLQMQDDGGRVVLKMNIPEQVMKIQGTLVTTKLIGKTKISEQYLEKPDGSSIKVDTDFYGKKRDTKQILPGPFKDIKAGMNEFVIEY